jgi:hypothetical protein
MTTVEVITSKEERRYWTRAEKMRWILVLNEPDANASDVAGAVYNSQNGGCRNLGPPSLTATSLALDSMTS